MCGIAGFIDRSGGSSADALRAQVQRMARAISHRGPDDSGEWVDPHHGVAFGHRRLSILDLTTGGHQPMHSRDGRYTVIFNGEIYNFRELRKQLSSSGHTFRGHSDTEVLLAAVTEWELRGALERFVGMFAFALWDAKRMVLSLARDRMGEKPLYYGWNGGALLFASELKALREFPGWQGEINRDALPLYFYGGYIPSPVSVYRGIYKLPPATFISFPEERMDHGFLPLPTTYWDFKEVARKAATDPFRGTARDAVDQLDRLLRESVAGQMVADVPVGAFLSGGIDSSTVTAVMQAQSSRPVRTFSIGFHEEDYNEAQHAKAVATHLETDHTELYVRPEEAIAVIPKLPLIYDEPFSDSSQIPTFLVSELARRHVTVSLSGDGGDELFGGYPRYALAQRLWSKMERFPTPVRRMGARMVKSVPVKYWNTSLSWMFRLLGKGQFRDYLGDRAHKGAELFKARTADELYWNLNSQCPYPQGLVLGASSELLGSAFSSRKIESSELLDQFCYADCVSYLPDDILVKVDRASMAVSLESRVPLLDHRLVSFAWSLPTSMKARNGEAKWILRQVLDRYVPRELVERPKMGFGVPIDRWLRGPLRAWAEDLLSRERLQREGLLDVASIRHKWEEHVSGKRHWHYHLWNVLMFEAWLEEQTASIS